MLMGLTYTEKVQLWQEATFQEIITSHNTHWDIQMPRRHGKTHLLRRLAKHYIEKGRKVFTITFKRGNNAFDGLKTEPIEMFVADEEDITNVVVLIEGIHKWNTIPKGGMIVNAYTPQDNYQQKDREYRILH
jgi:hypothetical protein